MARRARPEPLLRLAKSLPRPVLNRLPSLAWALLVRLPQSWASKLVELIVPVLYRAVQYEGAAEDDRFMRTFVDPRVEWSPPASFPDAEVYRGHAGVRGEVVQFKDAWQEIDQDVTAVSVSIPARTILVSVGFKARGRGSGIESSWEEFHVHEIERGRIVRLQMFRDRSEALQAAGLPWPGKTRSED
jgi:ketosteroid isomerase-like protein